MPRLDFPARHFVRFQMDVHYDWTPERRELFADSLTSDPEQGHVFPADASALFRYSYKTPDTRMDWTAMIAVIEYSDGDDRFIDITMMVRPTEVFPEYQLESARPLRHSEFFRAAHAMGEPSIAYAIATAVFDEVSPDDMWFPLPTVFEEPEGVGGRIELESVSGRKRVTDEDQDFDEYRFELSRLDDGTVRAQVTEYWSEVFDPDLIRAAFHRAAITIERLVGTRG